MLTMLVVTKVAYTLVVGVLPNIQNLSFVNKLQSNIIICLGAPSKLRKPWKPDARSKNAAQLIAVGDLPCLKWRASYIAECGTEARNHLQIPLSGFPILIKVPHIGFGGPDRPI